MRLAASNIAWDTDEDETIVKLLKKYEIDAIDIAPGKYFPNLPNTTDKEITEVKKWWDERSIEITGMQALLFGTSGLNVFGTIESREAMIAHLTAVCRIGGGLGAKKLVFGSPRNRDRTGLTENQAFDTAATFFSKVGAVAQSYGVILCLEPNPTCYGANFMTTSDETAQVVSQVSHPCIKMQFDTGAVAINGENPEIVLQKYAQLVGHIHASEPDLLPLGDANTEHKKMSSAIEKFLPNHLVSIEMLATKNEAHESSIERAFDVATRYYRHKSTSAHS